MVYRILLLTSLNIILRAQTSESFLLEDIIEQPELLPCLQKGNKSQELIAAALNNDLETVSRLLKVPDININDTLSDGSTALMIAVENQSIILAQILINAGANVNCVTKYYEETPLMIAVRQNNLEMIRLLLSSGANIDIKNRLQQSALDISWTDESRALLYSHSGNYCCETCSLL